MDLRAINSMPLKEAAITYGSLGWPILPLIPNRKQPASDVVKHGLLEATSLVETIRSWWDHNPDYNIGLVTGIVFDVVDLDGEDGVRQFYNWLPNYKHPGPIQLTGKGYHLFFEKSGSKNHSGIQKSKVDYRGIRGYVVGSPSVHPRGHRYNWARSGEVLPSVPDELRPLLFPETKVRKSQPNDPKIAEALNKEKNIVEIFEEMGYKITPWGNKAYLQCPFHEGDNQPSLVLYLKTNSFYCFGCDAWGDPLNVRRWQKTGKLR